MVVVVADTTLCIVVCYVVRERVRKSARVFSSCKEKQKEIKLMTRDVGCAAPGRLWFRHAEDKERKRVRKRAQRETRERTTLITKKTQKSKKWQKRKKREKDKSERADREKIFSSSVFFFRARELFFLSSLISALSDALLKKEQTL